MKSKKIQFSVILGMVLIAIILILCLVSFFWLPYDPDRIDTANRFSLPTAAHLLGTDQFGRDVLSRIMVASRSALLVGLCSVSVGALIGLVVGAVAAMSGPRLQSLIMRVIDGFMAFPGILLAMMLVAVLGKGQINAVIAIGIFMIPSFSRLVYSMILENKTRLHIKAARSYGCGSVRIVISHIFPDMLPRMVTQFSSSIGGAILTESSLSFLGLGIQPPSASWGMMLSEARQYVLTYPFIAVAPGVVLLIAVLGFNLLGDGLNDRLVRRGVRS